MERQVADPGQRARRPARDDERKLPDGFERHATRGARGGDAGQRAQTLAAVAGELADPVARLEARSGDRHAQGQEIARVESWPDRAQRHRRPNEQRGADHEHQRERDLQDDQHRASAGSTKARDRRDAGALQRNVEIGARGLKSGQESKDDAGRDRDDERERQHAPVGAHADGTARDDARDRARAAEIERIGLRIDGEKHPDRRHAGAETQDAARERQDEALGHQLPDDPSSSRTDRRSDRHLALSDIGANEQQIRDVRAGDEQEQTDRREQEIE